MSGGSVCVGQFRTHHFKPRSAIAEALADFRKSFASNALVARAVRIRKAAAQRRMPEFWQCLLPYQAEPASALL
jgi:hypothetical protein